MTGFDAVTIESMTAHGIPAEQAATFLSHLRSPAGVFATLPLAEQKDRTHRAACDAALRFITAPWDYVDPEDGDPDPMRAFYGLEHLSHTRDLATFALLVLRAGVLDPGTARDLAVFAWRIPEWPEQPNTELWRETWTRVGFASDTEDVHPPTSPLVLYRGAAPKFKRGMAWTGDLDRARWFAGRFPKSTTGGPFVACRVYEATVGPDRVYARVIGRGEDEWVIDTRRLPIRTLEVTSS